MKKTLIIVMISLVLSWVTSVETAFAVWLGDAAPEFTLNRIDTGTPVSLSSLKGRVVLIDFWASWCGPCKKEMPELDRLYKKLDHDKVKIIAVNIDKKVEKARAFLRKVPVNFTVLLDTDSKIVKNFGIRAMPTSFILDQHGVVKYVHLGFNKKDPAKWVDEIDNLLATGGGK